MKGMTKVSKAAMDLPLGVLGSLAFWVKKSRTPTATPRKEVVMARAAKLLVAQLIADLPLTALSWLIKTPTSFPLSYTFWKLKVPFRGREPRVTHCHEM